MNKVRYCSKVLSSNAFLTDDDDQPRSQLNSHEYLSDLI